MAETENSAGTGKEFHHFKAFGLYSARNGFGG